MKHTMGAYLLTAGTALAHGGHEDAVVRGDAHWLTTGDHLIVLLLAGFALGLGARPVLRRLRVALTRA